MKKACFVLALILILCMLCSCGGYVKSYSATILITSGHGDEAIVNCHIQRRQYKIAPFGACSDKEMTLDLFYFKIKGHQL